MSKSPTGSQKLYVNADEVRMKDYWDIVKCFTSTKYYCFIRIKEGDGELCVKHQQSVKNLWDKTKKKKRSQKKKTNENSKPSKMTIYEFEFLRKESNIIGRQERTIHEKVIMGIV